MREQEEARPKITTDGVRRKICCFGMGWWGCAKREQFVDKHGEQDKTSITTNI